MRKKIILLISISLFSILIFCAFYNGLIVRKYTITTSKLSVDASVRVVLISDLHSYIYGKDQDKLVSLIKKQNPDIIALAGDIADDMMPIEGTKL